MKTIRGQVNEAVVFTDQLEEMAEQQIQRLCDQEFVRGSIYMRSDNPIIKPFSK